MMHSILHVGFGTIATYGIYDAADKFIHFPEAVQKGSYKKKIYHVALQLITLATNSLLLAFTLHYAGVLVFNLAWVELFIIAHHAFNLFVLQDFIRSSFLSARQGDKTEAVSCIALSFACATSFFILGRSLIFHKMVLQLNEKLIAASSVASSIFGGAAILGKVWKVIDDLAQKIVAWLSPDEKSRDPVIKKLRFDD